MLSLQFFYPLLAVVSLCGLVSATPLPEFDHVIDKRETCAEFNPGDIYLTPSKSAFIVCNNISFVFQEDGNFVAYDGPVTPPHVAVWATNTGGRTCSGNNCTFEFQRDGNLVEYFNRSPIFYTGTGANIGRQLWFQNVPPYLYILNSAGSTAWQS